MGKDHIQEKSKFDFIHLRRSRGVGEGVGQASEQCLRNFDHVGSKNPWACGHGAERQRPPAARAAWLKQSPARAEIASLRSQ